MPEIGNTSVFSQTDASNNAGTVPSWEEGMAPSKVNDSARALQGAITREWNWRNYTLTSGGSADTQTLSYSVTPAAYYNGQRFAFIAGFTNATTTPTLNVNSLGAVTMKKMSAGVQSALVAGDITAGNFYEAVYNTSGSAFIITAGIGSAPTAATTTEQLTGTSTTVFSTPDSIAALWEKGSDVASAGTISLGEGGYFHITGTTTITDIDFATAKNGRTAFCVFDGALTLTHNATTLILPGGANITTAAGDTAIFVQDNGDNVQCVLYQRASGQALTAPTPTWTFVKKTSDTSRNTTTTTSADPDLQFSMAASTRYAIRMHILYTTADTPDFKFGLSGPASPTLVQGYYLIGAQAVSINGTNFTAYPTNVASAVTPHTQGTIPIDLIVQNGTNAGTFSFDWAQNTSSGSATIVKAGSYLEYAIT